MFVSSCLRKGDWRKLCNKEHGRDKKCIENFSSENLRAGDNLEKSGRKLQENITKVFLKNRA
jgi:hypothetical protein